MILSGVSSVTLSVGAKSSTIAYCMEIVPQGKTDRYRRLLTGRWTNDSGLHRHTTTLGLIM